VSTSPCGGLIYVVKSVVRPRFEPMKVRLHEIVRMAIFSLMDIITDKRFGHFIFSLDLIIMLITALLIKTLSTPNVFGISFYICVLNRVAFCV
jgi:hypothetical protein